MYSNTEPSGECFYCPTDTQYGHYAYNAFDRNDSTVCCSPVTTPIADFYLGYMFESPVNIKRIYLKSCSQSDSHYFKFGLKGSNDRKVCDDISLVNELKVMSVSVTDHDAHVNNNKYYKYYKIVIVDSNSSTVGQQNVRLLFV